MSNDQLPSVPQVNASVVDHSSAFAERVIVRVAVPTVESVLWSVTVRVTSREFAKSEPLERVALPSKLNSLESFNAEFAGEVIFNVGATPASFPSNP